ncbi:MAG: hypothetical protein RLZZ597_2043 [Cyanobacteriota bacterium]|jgi:hypothetical protein
MDMDVEVALKIVAKMLSPHQLSYVEELVFVRTWQGQLYREMALETGYEEGYLRGYWLSVVANPVSTTGVSGKQKTAAVYFGKHRKSTRAFPKNRGASDAGNGKQA